ncbi:MAG TPA: protoheme IX farnesyltransferase, partial [Verrucomicrobiales bacterium]|nr:protoheme IX farnesyltransferase [Verrucomicrobiales bacterium]
MLLINTLLGTGLLASAAAALNQYAEREYDARMPRTAKRPIPSGEISSRKAVIFGGVAAILGIIYLAHAV